MRCRFPDWRALALALTLLQGCAQAVQTEPDEAAPAVPAAGEIHLNLPQQGACDCPQVNQGADYTFFEKGVDTLALGNFQEAVQYFQRYQRLENSPEAQWEGEIAQAYVGTLVMNPQRDTAAARSAFNRLNKEEWRAMQLHPQALLLRQALANFLVELKNSTDASKEISALQADLAKREETIKRLRELTLGQKGASQ